MGYLPLHIDGVADRKYIPTYSITAGAEQMPEYINETTDRKNT